MRLWERLQRQQTVRPRSGGIPVFLCVLMFAITAIIVNRLGRERWIPVSCQPTYTATAYAFDKGTGVKTPFTCTDVDPRRAIEMANELAERHASDRVAQWRRGVERRRVKAGELAEKARQDHRKNLERLEAFQREQHEAAPAQAQSQANASRQEMPQPTMIENPRWLDLHAAGFRSPTTPRATPAGSHAVAPDGAGDNGTSYGGSTTIGGNSATDSQQRTQGCQRRQDAGSCGPADRRLGRERKPAKARRTDRGGREIAAGLREGGRMPRNKPWNSNTRGRNSSSRMQNPCKTSPKSTMAGDGCSGPRLRRAC